MFSGSVRPRWLATFSGSVRPLWLVTSREVSVRAFEHFRSRPLVLVACRIGGEQGNAVVQTKIKILKYRIDAELAGMTLLYFKVPAPQTYFTIPLNTCSVVLMTDIPKDW